MRPRRPRPAPISHRVFYVLALLVVLSMVLGLFVPVLLTGR
jgi:hypothetical protein